ncbi:MAG: HAMP domain-containing histidine kinase [Lachnospiraceae bacterium]|nr:HAMP domain-containing histidine kinase [Lachnospiraceae bacterium]
MKNKNDENSKRVVKGSVYSMIIINYLIAAVIIVVLWLIIIHSSKYLRGKALEQPDIQEFLDQAVAVKDNDYSNLDIDKYLGKNGYIEVLDGDANIIYSSDKSKNNKYTKRAVKFIPDVDIRSFYYIEKIYTEGGHSEYLVSKFKIVEEEDVYSILSGVAVLDGNRKVIYSNMDMGSSQFTQAEINVITGLEDDMTYAEKYVINLSDGSWRYLIMHLDSFSKYNDGRQERITVMVYTVGIILMLLFMGLFALRISRNVKKPLNILEDEMKELTEKGKLSDPYYKGPREFVGIINSFDDMSTKLRKSEDRRIKMEIDRQKMLMDISHDLRTPLTVILGYSKLIESGEASDTEIKEMSSKIVRKAGYMQELVENFFLFSKLESPQFRLEMERGNICDYFREYIAGKYGELEDQGYELEFDIPEDAEFYAVFDKIQLQRSFENIIANSVKHNEKGTKIYAAISSEEKNVIIRLGDNGKGISKDLRKNIFDPFIIGDEARGGKGTGLGLSIVKKIVEAHSGRVRLIEETQSEWKTLFEIVIPLTD